MLFNVERETRFDLRFRLFGTPIRVTPWFWFVTAASGFRLIQDVGFEYLFIWIACVFFSILMHEFGHIWMGRAFGNHGEIVLQAMCGLAVGSNGQYERWKRILVSLAGPGIELIFSGVLITLLMLFGNDRPFHFRGDLHWFDNIIGWLWHLSENASRSQHVRYVFFFLLQINFIWAAVNLVPVWPLDGGQVSREIFTRFSQPNGVRASLALSIAVAVLICVHSASSMLGGPRIPLLPHSSLFVLLLFAILALMSFQLLQFENARKMGHWRDPDEDRLPWESDPDEWKRR